MDTTVRKGTNTSMDTHARRIIPVQIPRECIGSLGAERGTVAMWKNTGRVLYFLYLPVELMCITY